MRTHYVAGLVAVALTLGASACTTSKDVPPEEAVLRLELDACRQGVGNRATAVSIGGGMAVTAAHSFDDVDGFRVVGPDDTSTPGFLVFRDRDRDIAVITFEDDKMPSGVQDGLVFAEDSEDTSLQVVLFRLEAPETQDVEVLRRVTLTLDGIGRRAGMELAADILRGDSGAPVVDDNGDIAGLIFATVRTGERAWAIAASEIATAPDDAAAPIKLQCS